MEMVTWEEVRRKLIKSVVEEANARWSFNPDFEKMSRKSTFDKLLEDVIRNYEVSNNVEIEYVIEDDLYKAYLKALKKLR